MKKIETFTDFIIEIKKAEKCFNNSNLNGYVDIDF